MSRETLFNTDVPTCPYCNHEIEEWYFKFDDDDSEVDVECDGCGKTYELEINRSISFDSWGQAEKKEEKSE